MNDSSHVNRYQLFLDQFQKRTALTPLARTFPRLSSTKDVAVCLKLLRSISSLALAGGDNDSHRKEWNPFSQRVYFVLPSQDASVPVPKNLNDGIDGIHRFILACHEAIHLLQWEHFFTGRTTKITLRHFTQASLSYEAFNFWYTDIILARGLREKLSDGEFVFSRRGVSQPEFHPYRAFKALKIFDPKKILKIYFRAFQGEKTILYRKRQNLIFNELMHRFGAFYFVSQKPLKRLHSALGEIGIFTDFSRKFCQLDSIPSLLPENSSRSSDSDYITAPDKFGEQLYDEVLPHLAQLPDHALDKVRMRRFIQTRAYASYCLKHILVTKNFVPLSGKPRFNADRALSDIETYLNRLRSILEGLCAGRGLSELSEEIRQCDQLYSRTVLSVFQKANIWVAKRQIILPAIPTRDAWFGVLAAASTRAELRKRVRFVQGLILDALSKGYERGHMPSNKLTDALSELNHLPKDHPEHAFNQIILRPEILELWSYPLGAFNPEKNQFAELLFSYE